MDLESETGRQGRRRQPFCLIQRKHALLAENIEESGQALIADRGNDRVNKKVKVVLLSIAEFVRDLVGAHERRDEVDRVAGAGVADGFELLDFVGEVEAVAAFGFGRRGAVEKHLVQAGQAKVPELFPGGGPGCPDG